MHTYMHTYMHAYMHTYMQAEVQMRNNGGENALQVASRKGKFKVTPNP
jgi:hypothetical protein